MISVNNLGTSERTEAEQLLKSEKLCFNDVKEDGVSLFEVIEGDETIGYFGIEQYGSYALFRSMVVKPKFRSRGYGLQLWLQAKKQLTKLEAKEVFLLTNTAGPFFKIQGFEEIPRSAVPEKIAATTEFVDFCPDDSVCMKIKLN